MASVNKVIILGNVGKDPETRYLPNGDAVTNLSVATTESWKDKNGDKKEQTEWHRVSLFKGLATVAAEYVKMGNPVYIVGRIQTRMWQDKEGNDRYSTEIVADKIQLLGGRQSETPDVPQARKSGGSVASMDNDIPFNKIGKYL